MPRTASELSAQVARTVRGRRVVVGLSGGLDSVALTHLLVCGGADVRVAHVDHGLRPDSDEDARFCAALAANLGLSFGCARVEIQRGNSTQGRARIQRYAALVRLAAELGGDLLAVAHHADDAWESSELQTARRAGAIGASGPTLWSEWHGFDLVRPLLDVRRTTIAEAAAELSLVWREDPSNLDATYERTRVRAEDNFDAELLAARRKEAEKLRDAVAIDRERRPLETVFSRAMLAGFAPDVRGRILLDAARELHAELPGAVATQLVDAIADEDLSPREYCGRRVVAEVSADHVTVVATRGQGTRLLGGRRTAAVTLTDARAVSWFGDRIEIAARHVGRTLRGPQKGDRFEGRSVLGLLARHNVRPYARWRWPCIFDRKTCIEVCGIAAAEL